MVVRHGWVVVGLAAIILSCAPPHREPISSAKLGTECRTWKGRSRSEIIAVWGEPTGSKSDGKGGLALEYRSLEIGTPMNPDLVVPRSEHVGNASDAPSSVRSVLPPDYVGQDVEAAFLIDPEGSVYDYRISPARWEKGFPLPCGGWYPGKGRRSFPSG